MMKQNIGNQIPTHHNDRYHQRESRDQNSNSLVGGNQGSQSQAPGNQERQKRKRDFSKVIDIAHKALSSSQTISHDMSGQNHNNNYNG